MPVWPYSTLSAGSHAATFCELQNMEQCGVAADTATMNAVCNMTGLIDAVMAPLTPADLSTGTLSVQLLVAVEKGQPELTLHLLRHMQQQASIVITRTSTIVPATFAHLKCELEFYVSAWIVLHGLAVVKMPNLSVSGGCSNAKTHRLTVAGRDRRGSLMRFHTGQRWTA